MTSASQRFGERMPKEQHEATIRSIDETKENVRRAIEEARRETPRIAQTVTDFQNETVDATKEVVETFLETQKDIVISMHSAWSDTADRAGGYPTGLMMQPWNYYYWWLTWGGMLSPMAVADFYARMLAFMTMNFATGTKIATNMMFAGLDTARATTRYARDSSKEMSRMMSINIRSMSHAARESVKVEGGSARTTNTAGEENSGTARKR